MVKLLTVREDHNKSAQAIACLMSFKSLKKLLELLKLSITIITIITKKSRNHLVVGVTDSLTIRHHPSLQSLAIAGLISILTNCPGNSLIVSDDLLPTHVHFRQKKSSRIPKDEKVSAQGRLKFFSDRISDEFLPIVFLLEFIEHGGSNSHRQFGSQRFFSTCFKSVFFYVWVTLGIAHQSHRIAQ